jgi:Asp-tRNA(Asn)/Glu-tRNA(Gln) amidotransferase A subunit family amidase
MRNLTRDIAALRTGERDVSAEVARTCGCIDEMDATILAFVPEPGRRARLDAEARAVTERWPDPASRPALYGVPVGVKDIIRVDGLPTRAGSAVPPDALSGAQAPVVDRLREAGALVAGKTATAEFAASAPGPTRNPRAPAHTPGGSSSGSAAAVAAGMVALAIGTQTIGSVIRPAAYCGVVGFKPTHGRIPADGVIANAPTFDTVGIFTADVAGAATAAAVLCDRWQPVAPDAARPVLGVPVGPYLGRAGAEATEAFTAQCAALRAAGFPVREVAALADFEDLVRHNAVVNRYEIARTHADWFPRFGHLYREQTVAAIREGLAIGRDDYLRALRDRERFRDRLLTAMSDEGVDVWIAPSTTGPAPEGLDSTGDPIMCVPWSNAGLPSVTLPSARVPAGLPFGLQCVGRPHADERLLARVATIEATLIR